MILSSLWESPATAAALFPVSSQWTQGWWRHRAREGTDYARPYHLPEECWCRISFPWHTGSGNAWEAYGVNTYDGANSATANPRLNEETCFSAGLLRLQAAYFHIGRHRYSTSNKKREKSRWGRSKWTCFFPAPLCMSTTLVRQTLHLCVNNSLTSPFILTYTLRLHLLKLRHMGSQMIKNC